MNNTNASSNLILDFEGREKSYLFSVYEGKESPDFFIVSDGNINAVSFEIPYDSTFIKSVSFFNGSSEGNIRIHIYEEPINRKARPASQSVLLENALSNVWIRVDLENLSVIRDADQVFEIGIEYLEKGNLGYSDTEPVATQSYLKPEGGIFRPLDDFSISDGESLDGLWMIRAEMAAPVYYKTDDSADGRLFWTNLGPTPFNPMEHEVLNIGYSYDGEGKITLDIFNMLGQRIYKTEDNRGAGLIYWDGHMDNGTSAASGMYILRLGSKNDKIYHKILVIK
jgi:hypothetical protein